MYVDYWLLWCCDKQISRYEVRKGTDGSLYGSVKKLESLKLQSMERDQRKQRGDSFDTCVTLDYNIIPFCYLKYPCVYQ